MQNSEAYYHNDAALLHRPDAAAVEPGHVDGVQRRQLGQRARLQRDQHALRDDHQEPLLQQCARHRPQRAGLREVPAGRAEHDHRQRRLLEQLQLPRGQAAVQGPRTTACPRWRRSAPASCCSAGAATASRTTASTATSSPAWPAAEDILVSKTPEARALANNVVLEQPVRPGRHRRQRLRPHAYDGNGTNNCFSMTGVTSMFPTDGSTFAGCGATNAFIQAGAGHDAHLDRRGRAEGLEEARRIPPSPGTRRLRPSGESSLLRRRRRARAQRGRRAEEEDVKVGDNYYAPKTLTVKKRHDGRLGAGRASTRPATSTTSSSSPARRA